MNRISPSSKLLRIAAKSPLFSIAGPEVTRILAPISLAITCAKVVFPNPGAPYNKICSTGSFLCLAAERAISRLALILSCPMYSRKKRGRNDLSKTASSVVSCGLSRRSSDIINLIIIYPKFVGHHPQGQKYHR